MYYDRRGWPISMTAWSLRHGDVNYRVVAQDRLRGWLVSTVWLGLDHNFFGQGPPLIFETMVFAPEGGLLGNEEYCERYATEEEARAGHYQALFWAVDKIRASPRVQWRAVPDDLEGLI
jgi:hypothetical protein